MSDRPPLMLLLSRDEADNLRRLLKTECWYGTQECRTRLIMKLTPPAPLLDNAKDMAHAEAAH